MAKLVIRSDGLPAEVIELKRGTNRFGRSSENDFQIEHPTVSRFHCEIQVKEEGLFVKDLDSSNGTFINDEPIRQGQLAKGSMLRLGDVKMEVKDVGKAAAAADPNVVACFNHPTLAASMFCTQCKKTFCGSCVHIMKKINGQYLRLCPSCSGHCEPIPVPGQAKPSAGKKIFSGLFDRLMKKTTQRPFHSGRRPQ